MRKEAEQEEQDDGQLDGAASGPSTEPQASQPARWDISCHAWLAIAAPSRVAHRPEPAHRGLVAASLLLSIRPVCESQVWQLDGSHERTDFSRPPSTDTEGHACTVLACKR